MATSAPLHGPRSPPRRRRRPIRRASGASRQRRASRKRLVSSAGRGRSRPAAASYWVHARHFEETDDAQIDGNISNVSPRVSGHGDARSTSSRTRR